MSKDFRASQIETSKLIASGGIGSKVGLVIYSGSIAADRSGNVTAPHNTKMLEHVGDDVFLFVSGTRSNSDFSRSDVTLFGGDVVVSGTLYAERQVIEVDGVVDGDMIVTASLFVEPDANSTKSVVFRRSDGTDIFVVDSSTPRIQITGSVGINGQIQQDNNQLILNANHEGNINTSNTPFLIKAKNNSMQLSASLAQNKFLITSDRGAGSSDIIFNPKGNLVIRRHSGVNSSNEFGATAQATLVFSDVTNANIDSQTNLDGSPAGSATKKAYIQKDASNNFDIVCSNDIKIRIDNSGQAKDILLQANNIAGSGVVVNEDGLANPDFRVESDSLQGAILVDSADNAVVFGSNVTTFAGLPEQARGADVNIVLSGSAGTKGTTSRGVVLIPGDLVVSGTLFGGSPLKVSGGLEVTGSLLITTGSDINVSAGGLTGSLQEVSLGVPYLKAGTDIQLSTASNGQVTITSTAGGGGGGSQNLFQTITLDGSGAGTQAGDANIIADSTTDTLTLKAGSNITLTGNASGDAITIDSAAGTAYTAGFGIDLTGTEFTQEVDIAVTVAGGKFVLDGTSQKVALLSKGFRYKFDQSDASNAGSGGHPLRFSTTSDGTHNGGSEYTTNVTTNGSPGSSGAYTMITLNQTTPDTLFYYCSSHSGMGSSAESGGMNAGDGLDKTGATLSLDLKSTGGLKIDSTELALDINNLSVDSNAGNLSDSLAIADNSDSNITKKITLTQLQTLVNTDTNTTYTAGSGLDLGGTEFTVDVSDFMTNGADNRVVTATGADAMNAESNLTFDGTDLSVSGKVKTTGVEYTDGDNSITVQDGGYLKFDAGVTHSPAVKVNANNNTSPDQWIKVATTDTGGTDGDTIITNLLINICGNEGPTDNADDVYASFLVHAEFTAKSSSPYYYSSGTALYVDVLSKDQQEGFNPNTDIMISYEQDSSPVHALYIKSKEQNKDVYVTHLGGTDNIGGDHTDASMKILTGQNWETSGIDTFTIGEEYYGAWASKILSGLAVVGATVSNDHILDIGTDVNDGRERKIIFDHAVNKTVIGIDDSEDKFSINCNSGGLFSAASDFQMDGSGNVTLNNGGLTLAAASAGNITIGSDADGNDRKITFGHSTLKSVIGISDAQDVFAINTDDDFESGNDLEIDASGNVTLGNGDLTVGGNDIKDSGGNTIVSSDGSGNGTFTGNATSATSATNATNATKVTVTDTTSGPYPILMSADVSPDGGYESVVASAKFDIFAGSSNYLKIIGDTVPSSISRNSHVKLWLQGGDDSADSSLMQIHSSVEGGILFGDTYDDDRGKVIYYHSSDYMYFTAGANEAVRVYGTGESLRTDDTIDTDSDFFTNGHQYFTDINEEEISVGDCCVLSNGILVKSSKPKQKNVAGIAWFSMSSKKEADSWRHDRLDLENSTREEEVYISKKWRDSLNVEIDRASKDENGNWVATDSFKSLWKVASIGDSRQPVSSNIDDLLGFKVCDENGPIEEGDLLCTSSTPGYLMKQDDDIIRSYTVGKAMENVTFDNAGKAINIYGYIYCG